VGRCGPELALSRDPPAASNPVRLCHRTREKSGVDWAPKKEGEVQVVHGIRPSSVRQVRLPLQEGFSRKTIRLKVNYVFRVPGQGDGPCGFLETERKIRPKTSGQGRPLRRFGGLFEPGEFAACLPCGHTSRRRAAGPTRMGITSGRPDRALGDRGQVVADQTAGHP